MFIPKNTLIQSKGCFLLLLLKTRIYTEYTVRSPCTQEVEGSTPIGGTCPTDFSNPIDHDIRTQWALSWKLVVSEWRSVIAVSPNVGGCVRLIKPAKLYMCTQNTTNTTRTDARRRVCAAVVSYRWATRGTALWELEYTHTHILIFNGTLENLDYD